MSRSRYSCRVVWIIALSTAVFGATHVHAAAGASMRQATAEQAAPVLIDLPMDVNADNCRGFTDVRYLDINGDGNLDIAVSMSVKSNSFYGYVNQQVVYLSSADKPGGYCYSPAASRNLNPADMGSANKVRQALDRVRKRLGIAQFDCGQ